MTRLGFLLALLLTCGLLVSLHAPVAQAEPSEDDHSYFGRSLTEVLLELRAGGLKIVFTSGLVRPEMTVDVEPAATEPRQIAEEILAPHGLTLREAPNDTLVAVRRAAGDEPAIGGLVLERATSTPLPAATVRIVETGQEAISDADGTFLIRRPGLDTFTVEAQLPGYTVERREGIIVGASGGTEIVLFLDPSPLIEDQLVVVPSRVSLLREEPAPLIAVTRDEIVTLPHLGDDFFRALSLLPGVAANDVSAQFHVRGARRDETQILLDGQELYEAYHLQDFDSALSLVAASTLNSADLMTGGFSARYGDRMSGVLEMTTVRPADRLRVRLGAGVSNAHAGAVGTFNSERGNWLVELRRGSIDLVGRLLRAEDPEYWDGLAKIEHQFGSGHILRANLLYSSDALDFTEQIGEETKLLSTDYDSLHFWLTHQVAPSNRMLIESAVSAARISRDRFGDEFEQDAQFRISDKRDSDVLELRQMWSLQATPRHFLTWGGQWREFDTEYDYFGLRNFDNPLAQIRHDFGEDLTALREEFQEEHTNLHVTDHIRLADSLTLELGLRFDRHTQTDESHGAPRLNLAWSPSERDVLRVAWGRFNQSQRAYELQVEDGETEFFPVERAEHRVIGYERRLTPRPKGPLSGLRIEAYRREVDNPRTRYENLYEAINTFPEVEPDRVRIAPDRSIAEGVELFVRGNFGAKANWWANYAYARTEDEIDGGRVARPFDQRHTLNLDLNYRVNDNWRLNLAWRYHSGWPTTPLSLEESLDDESAVVFVPVLGPINSLRLPDYHRLDLRASRHWQLRSVALDLFFDVQNVYDRGNIAGFDHEIDDEAGTILANVEEWVGILPSVGISVEF